MQSCTVLGEAQPQLIIHAVVPGLVEAAAGPLPQIAGEHDLGLVEEPTGQPAAIQVEQLIQRQRSVLATGQVLGQRAAVAVQQTDARDHVRTAGEKAHGCGGQRPRCQHIVAIEPGENLARGPGEAFVDGVRLAAVGLADHISQVFLILLEHVERAVG